MFTSLCNVGLHFQSENSILYTENFIISHIIKKIQITTFLKKVLHAQHCFHIVLRKGVSTTLWLSSAISFSMLIHPNLTHNAHPFFSFKKNSLLFFWSLNGIRIQEIWSKPISQATQLNPVKHIGNILVHSVADKMADSPLLPFSKFQNA